MTNLSNSRFVLTPRQLQIWCAGDGNLFGCRRQSLACHIEVGVSGRGGGIFQTYRIHFSADALELKTMALGLLACAIGSCNEIYIPVTTPGLVVGIKMVVATLDRPKSFSYLQRMSPLKRYPWHPWSFSCNAFRELPTFGIEGVPGERDHLLWDNRRDLRKPHAIWIGGHPNGLIRLARLLLDYANTDIPPDDIVLEVEGGFRGVGPHSYEARFERIGD